MEIILSTMQLSPSVAMLLVESANKNRQNNLQQFVLEHHALMDESNRSSIPASVSRSFSKPSHIAAETMMVISPDVCEHL